MAITLRLTDDEEKNLEHLTIILRQTTKTATLKYLMQNFEDVRADLWTTESKFERMQDKYNLIVKKLHRYSKLMDEVKEIDNYVRTAVFSED